MDNSTSQNTNESTQESFLETCLGHMNELNTYATTLCRELSLPDGMKYKLLAILYRQDKPVEQQPIKQDT